MYCSNYPFLNLFHLHLYCTVSMSAVVDTIWHQRHDLCNLVVLPLIITTNLAYLIAIYHYGSNNTDVVDDLYDLMFYTFSLYLTLDCIWLLLKPASVASPTLIILHHIVSIAGWISPYFDKEIRPWAAAAIIVEINTFFLILRRNVKPSWLLDNCFLISWVSLRLCVYPYIAFGYYSQFSSLIYPFNGYNLSYLCLLSLIILNGKWSYDLYKKWGTFYFTSTEIAARNSFAKGNKKEHKGL